MKTNVTPNKKAIPGLICIGLAALLAVSCAGGTGTPAPTSSPASPSPATLTTGAPPTASVSPTPSVTVPSATTGRTTTSAPPTATTTPTPTMTGTPPPTSTAPAVVAFDFETGTPALIPRSASTPFDQTSGGVTAHFASPSDPAAFSVQSQATTSLMLAQFTQNYLYQNGVYRTSLSISFSQQLSGITFTFATTDSHGPGNVDQPSDIRLTAYMNSAGTAPVGSAVSAGTFTNDSYPQGKLSFVLGGKPFDLVVIDLPYQGVRGATGFLIDDIVATAYQ